jgi:GH43 family beta-xylosidase
MVHIFAAGTAEKDGKYACMRYRMISEDPTKGKWIEEGQILSKRDDSALDATTFEHDGQLYYVWTDRASDKVVNTGLYIAEMTSPTTMDENQVVITQPEYSWEVQGHRVNEAPAVLIRNGKVFVTFSASAPMQTTALVLLWAYEGSDLLDPDSWHKLTRTCILHQ